MSAGELSDLIADIAAGHTEPPPGELPSCWPVLVELGLPLVGIEEERGGSGGSLTDLVVLMRALGRHALSTPLSESAVANWVVAAARGDATAGPGLRTIMVGDPAGAGGWTAGAAGETAGTGRETTGTGGETAGTADVAAGRADVAAGTAGWVRHADEIVLYRDEAALLADVRAPGVTVTPGLNVAGEPLDGVHLSAAALVPLDGAPPAEAVRARLGLLRAAALTGAAEGAYELTRGHVITREQFGQPLVRIPAVASNLAMVKAAVIQCDAALTRACERVSLASVAAARIIAGRAATQTARIAHQLHGAIGVTEEYRLHHYTKRLWAWRDADWSEHEWSVLLGDLAATAGEPAFWDDLTA